MFVKLENLGTINKNRVHISTNKAEITIYFSYETPVSFQYYHPEKQIKEKKTRINEWGPTSGKFINSLEPVKHLRLEGWAFEGGLNKALKSLLS